MCGKCYNCLGIQRTWPMPSPSMRLELPWCYKLPRLLVKHTDSWAPFQID